MHIVVMKLSESIVVSLDNKITNMFIIVNFGHLISELWLGRCTGHKTAEQKDKEIEFVCFFIDRMNPFHTCNFNHTLHIHSLKQHQHFKECYITTLRSTMISSHLL